MIIKKSLLAQICKKEAWKLRGSRAWISSEKQFSVWEHIDAFLPTPSPKPPCQVRRVNGDDLGTLGNRRMQGLVPDVCLRRLEASSLEQSAAKNKEGMLWTCLSRAMAYVFHRPDEGWMERYELVSPWKGGIQKHWLELSDPISRGWLPDARTEASPKRGQLR